MKSQVIATNAGSSSITFALFAAGGSLPLLTEGQIDGIGLPTSSWNCGAEGPTDDPAILELRERQKRNFLATLFLSQGVPMLVSGDELGRTQQGNDNAYCQDNELSWLNWNLDDAQRSLLEFTGRLIAFRLQHPNLRRYKFFQGRAIRGGDVKDIVWLRPDGQEMTGEEWDAGWQRTLGLGLDGDGMHILNEKKSCSCLRNIQLI